MVLNVIGMGFLVGDVGSLMHLMTPPRIPLAPRPLS